MISLLLIAPWVCQVDAGNDRGTGVLVREGYVATNLHVIKGHPDAVTVTFPDGREFRAEWFCSHVRADLAILRIGETGITPPSIRGSPVREGEPLWSGPRFVEGHAVLPGAVRYLRSRGAETQSGDSGGPIVDANGELVSIMWGCLDGEVWGCTLGELKDICELGELNEQTE